MVDCISISIILTVITILFGNQINNLVWLGLPRLYRRLAPAIRHRVSALWANCPAAYRIAMQRLPKSWQTATLVAVPLLCIGPAIHYAMHQVTGSVPALLEVVATTSAILLVGCGIIISVHGFVVTARICWRAVRWTAAKTHGSSP